MSAATKPLVDTSYMTLIRRFPLRRIQNQAAHRQALAIIAELSSKGDTKLTDGEIDYLEALGRFVADYEHDHSLNKLSQATPLQVLQHLMEERGMTPADLGNILGSRPAATMILKGQREMSKAHIRTAADYFAVSAAVFL